MNGRQETAVKPSDFFCRKKILSPNNFRTIRPGRWQRHLRSRCHPLDPRGMAQSALIIAPHFDDEVLGCGGTIIRLRQLGAEVGLIFMTDGTGSHSGHVSPKELTAQRSAEGNAAAAVMGLAPEDVTLLGLPEARLSDFFEECTASLLAIIQQRHPDAIFLPYRHEPLIWSSDHRQTTAITLAALRASGRSVTLYEYPIWAWYGLPWLRPSWPPRRETLRLLKNSASNQFGRLLWRDCHHYVDISSVREQKQHALTQHRSQMFRPKDDPQWTILADLADGQFLACFYGDSEYFCVRSFPAN